MEPGSELAFWLNELKPLINGVVIGTIHDEEGFYGLQIQKGDDVYYVWFSRDEEQNAPGAAIVHEMLWEDSE